MLCRQNGRGSARGRAASLPASARKRTSGASPCLPSSQQAQSRRKEPAKRHRARSGRDSRDHPQKRKAAQKRQERSSRPHRISGEALGATGGVKILSAQTREYTAWDRPPPTAPSTPNSLAATMAANPIANMEKGAKKAPGRRIRRNSSTAIAPIATASATLTPRAAVSTAGAACPR